MQSMPWKWDNPIVLLARYLLRLFGPSFLLALGVCTAVLLMNQFLRLFNLALLKGISPFWIAACFARLFPYFLSLAAPMAFLVALLLVLGQLSENGEVMALRSSGFSFREILTPFFYIALALSAVLFYVNHKASPEGYHSFKKSYEAAARQISAVDLEARTFTALGDWRLFAHGVDRASGRLDNVYLVKQRGANRGLRVSAPEGRLSLERGMGVELLLFRGNLQLPARTPEDFVSATFKKYRLFLPFQMGAPPAREPDLQELNTFRLRDRLRDPELDGEKRKEFTTEAALRSAGALTPLILFWLACPLGIGLERRARAAGFAWSLGILFVYYGLLALGIGLGRRSLALAPYAPWIPDAAGFVAGAVLWRKRLRR